MTPTASIPGRSLFALALATGALASSAQSQTLTFSDQTDAAGLTTTQTAPLGPETNMMLGGAAVADFDNDGWQDLFVPMIDVEPDRLFFNDGDGTFTEDAAGWGVDATHIAGGMAVGDYDNDGFTDMFLTSHGTFTGYLPGQHKLYHNLGNSFEEVAAAAGVAFASPVNFDGMGACFGDSDLDGDLDLFVTGWIIDSQGNRYFLNDGDGTFTDVTYTKIGPSANIDDVRGYTPIFVDMNEDLLPELLIAGDFETSRYLVNVGNGDFVDRTASSGTAIDQFGMGGTVADFNADGRPDWYVTSIYGEIHLIQGFGNRLYRQDFNHVYSDVTALAGVDDGGWGWGTVAVDLNHDRYVDIAETNGWFQPTWVGENDYIFLNGGPSVGFTDAANVCGVIHASSGKGLVHFDYDNDGDQDLVFCSNDEPLKLFRNDLGGPDTNWLRVTLDNGGASHIAPHGYGARVEVTSGGVTQKMSMTAGGSFISQSELVCHFGLGDHTSASLVKVFWGDGSESRVVNPRANQTLHIVYEDEEPPFVGEVQRRGGITLPPLAPPKTQ